MNTISDMTLQKYELILFAITITIAVLMLVAGIPLFGSIVAAIAIFIGVRMYMKRSKNLKKSTRRAKAKDGGFSLKQKVVAITLVAMIAAIIASVTSNDTEENVQKSAYDIELEKQQEAIKAVAEYRGKDGKGETLLETLSVIINVTYSNEDIFENPSTQVDWYAFEDPMIRDKSVYKVGFVFETYRESVEYIWYYDPSTKQISAGDKHAKSILDTLDAFG
jgi:hypothetical protein